MSTAIGLPARGLRIGLAGLGVLMLCGLVAYSVWPQPRSFAVQTTTRGLDIVFDGTAMNTWLLDEAVVCFRRESRARAAAVVDAPDAPCDPALFEIAHYAALELAWSSNAQVQIGRAAPEGALEIQVIDTGPTPTTVEGRSLSKNSRVIVPNAAWQQGSTLTLAGRAVIGSAPGPGSQRNILGGTYAVSERMPWAGSSVVVTRGELLSGDEARLVQNGPDGPVPVNVFGFLEPRNLGEAGFGATIYSPLGDNRLSIDRFGAVDIEIAPSWTDRALANPVLLASSAIVALLSGIAGLSWIMPLGRWIWLGRQE